MLSGTVHGNWFPNFLCIKFLFFNVCISFPSKKGYSLKWYKTGMVGFFGHCSQHLDRNWTPKWDLPANPLKQLSSSDRDKKNGDSPVHCKWICYVQTDPCSSSLSFNHGKPVMGKNCVVLLLPACRHETWAGNWYGRHRTST